FCKLGINRSQNVVKSNGGIDIGNRLNHARPVLGMHHLHPHAQILKFHSPHSSTPLHPPCPPANILKPTRLELQCPNTNRKILRICAGGRHKTYLTERARTPV